jgi:hypothetical protein
MLSKDDCRVQAKTRVPIGRELHQEKGLEQASCHVSPAGPIQTIPRAQVYHVVGVLTPEAHQESDPNGFQAHS